MKRLLFLSLSFLFWVGIANSNNVRFKSSARILSVDDGIATIGLGLKWDKAWRDFNNWDGVWLFFKYREGTTGAWKHVNLETSGHSIVDTSSTNANKYTYHIGRNGADKTKATGLFVLLSENASANPRLNCQFKWKLPEGVTKDDFDNGSFILYAHGLEMVYVRTGSYTLGQQYYKWAFNATYINSENGLDVDIITDGNGLQTKSLTDSYPKGFQGFYAMKYELGQEQCVRFLNSLLRSEQEALVPNIKKRENNNNIFGDEETVSTKRNGIVLAEKSTDQTSPHRLACDLNRDNPGNYFDDGQNIACGFMNVNFLRAYCSWSGLRPMSELEFEKSCRRPFPSVTVDDEYVWGGTEDARPTTGIVVSSASTSSEMPLDGNVNSFNAAGQSYQNPIRSGGFAAVANTSTDALDRQHKSGATYWGLMEMGGNLKEIVGSVENTNFPSDKHGLGTYKIDLWSGTPSHYGYRGGGFESAIELLQTNNRTEMKGIITAVDLADQSSAGFRGVRSFSSEDMGISVTAGAIAADNICGARDIHIIETSAASLIGADGEQAVFTYEWYVDDTLINNFSSSEYVIQNAVAGREYTLKRFAVCQYGVNDASIKFTVPKISLNIDTCIIGLPDSDLNTLKISLGGATNKVIYDWYYKDKWVHSGDSYTPIHNEFSGNTGFLDLSYRATLANCIAVFEGSVKVYNACSDSVMRDDDGNIYPIVVGTNGADTDRPYQCWMAENLKVGDYQHTTTSGAWQFDEAGIQKWCSANNPSNCETYGGLYEFWEMVCGGDCGGKMNTGDAQNVAPSNETQLIQYGAKMVFGSNTLVQGICPRGWHIPTNADWSALAKVQKGFNFELGGYRSYNNGGFYLLRTDGYWWSSTPNGSNSRFGYLTNAGVGMNIDVSHKERSYGYSVRCIQN